jgi:N-acetylneuraminate synthase
MGGIIKIAGREIGEGNPTFIVAEGCDNHLGDMSVAREMVVRAHRSGADAIKFQHHLPDEEMLPVIPLSDNFEEPLYDFLKKYALTLDQHRELKALCEETGILYLCTPFSFAAAKELFSIGVSAYKIGSGEMTDIPSLERIADFGKPMIISTGMCTTEEIDRTYRAIIRRNSSLSLLNCVIEYPPAYTDINLDVITLMQEQFSHAVIGHSDHTPDLFTSYAAVTLGAKIIEKHVIIDKNQPGPDQSVSIDFEDLTELVDGIRKIESARGCEKKVHGLEKPIRSWAFRSLVSIRNIQCGETISEDMIWSKRPGTGIPSHEMRTVIGREAARDIKENTMLSWEDFVVIGE